MGANVVQKGVVTGLFSVFAWQAWQIGAQCSEYSANKRSRIEDSSSSYPSSRNQHTAIMDAIREKVDEEARPHDVGTIPDRYDPEDDSYLEKLPDLTGAINNRGRSQ